VWAFRGYPMPYAFFLILLARSVVAVASVPETVIAAAVPLAGNAVLRRR
jgi:hypothetical protein